jgi:hypothetical protein
MLLSVLFADERKYAEFHASHESALKSVASTFAMKFGIALAAIGFCLVGLFCFLHYDEKLAASEK